MIEFKGYLSGHTEKYYHHKERMFVFWTFCSVILVLGPFLLFLLYRIFGLWQVFPVFGGLFLMFPISILIMPITKSTKEQSGPYRITIVDEEITYYTKGGEEDSRMVDEVTQLIDHGEWYTLDMPGRKKNGKFIFQKNLLTQGTLEEFEALFEGKIIRKTHE